MTGQDGQPCEHDDQAPVHVLIERVRNQMEPIEKRGTAPKAMGEFKFRRINDVLAKLDPLLGNERVFYFPRVRRFEQRDIPGSQGKVQHHTTVHIDLVWKGPAGDELVMDGVGEAIDSFDKGVGKATTNAVKNTIGVWLAQPTIDLEESDIDGATADEHVTDGYADPAAYEDLRALVKQLPDEARAQVVDRHEDGSLRILGVLVTDTNNMVVMRVGEYERVRAALVHQVAEHIKAEESEASDEPSTDSGAAHDGEAAANAAERTDAPEAEKHGYELWSHKDLDAVLEQRGLSTTGTIIQKAMRLRAWDSTNMPDGYVEPNEATF